MNITRTTRTALIALIAAAGLATTASAQSATSRSMTQENNRTTVTEMADGNEYKLELNDGALRVWFNGQEVPASQYRRMGSRVELLDDFGRVQRVFSIQAPPAPPAPPAAVTALRGTADAGARPPVMLGVTLSSPSEALRNQLGLSGEGGILINSTIQDLPADRAGLKPFDIIVELHDRRGEAATQDALRDLLRDRRPGDTLNMTVLRAGEKRDIALKLDAYDPERLRNLGSIAFPGAPGTPEAPQAPDQPGAVTLERDLSAWLGTTGQDAARSALESALSAMKDLDAQLPAEVRAQLAEARAQLAEAIKGLDDRGVQAFRFNFPGNGAAGSSPFVLDNNRLIRVPWAEREAEERQTQARQRAETLRADAERDRERIVVRTEDQIRSIEQRMRELDERLSRFERSMDRFERLIERMERDQ